jgi:hypothetical protein
MAGKSKFARLYRVIIRFSFDSDTSSAVRNEVEKNLVAVGISNTKTGTWESESVTLKKATNAIEKVFNVLANPRLVSGADRSFALDNLWIYVDGAV